MLRAGFLFFNLFISIGMLIFLIMGYVVAGAVDPVGVYICAAMIGESLLSLRRLTSA